MSVSAERPWGSHSLLLSLPAVIIKLNGLTKAQIHSLQGNYQRFFCEPSPITDEYCIECNVYQLDREPCISHKEVSWKGQYAPRQVRLGNGIELTGINFQAKIISPCSHKFSSISVVNEQDIAKTSVIENFLRILTAHQALSLKGLVLHSAGLVYDDLAFIFSGRSNAGKTTLTRKAYQHGARVLSDDINVLLPEGEGYRAYAVPFTGEFGRTLEHQGGQESYPVAGIILLEQGDGIRTEKVKNSDAVAALLAGCPFVNTVAEESASLFEAVINLVAHHSVIRLVSGRDDRIDEIMAAVKKELQAV
ncbi:hypothetical protein VU01_10116 [Candidatus Electrothrix marina]|uniref:Hpr(Ser) kinase/phosphatase n=1 Tax=Candidatus Electrothrix marina TaxID=1859130 RepID=A0A444JHA5_9BACT|nr:hypothetical protein VU01_10116 [Candidatus Electrothrix marina]